MFHLSAVILEECDVCCTEYLVACKKKTLGGKDQNERSLFSVLTQVRGSLVECCVAGEWFGFPMELVMILSPLAL